jgi:hypothetical protein
LLSYASGDLPPTVIALQFGQLGVDGFHFDTVVDVYDFGKVEDDTFSFIERIHLHEEIAKEAQQKEVNSCCSAALQIDHLRPKESIYSLFWGAVNLESYIGPEVVQRYERLVDLSAKLKMQQVDPDLIMEDYNGLTISEMIRRC